MKTITEMESIREKATIACDAARTALTSARAAKTRAINNELKASQHLDKTIAAWRRADYAMAKAGA